MNVVTYSAFRDELEKIGSLAEHALDVGGLAMLAAPTIQKMRGKKMSDKRTGAAELGGLGVLAAHPAYSIGKRLLTKKGSVVRKVKISSKMPGQVLGAFGAGTGKGIADTVRRASASGAGQAGGNLAQRIAARRAQMSGIAHAANPVKTLPAAPGAIHLGPK